MTTSFSDFAEFINQGFGASAPSSMDGSDVIPTHPGEARATSPADDNELAVRYKQFDLARSTDVEELEFIMTEIAYGRKLKRMEKWNTDQQGSTSVTVSWIDLIPKKKPRGAEAAAYATHGVNPGIEDDAYPGTGAPDLKFAFETPADDGGPPVDQIEELEEGDPPVDQIGEKDF